MMHRKLRMNETEGERGGGGRRYSRHAKRYKLLDGWMDGWMDEWLDGETDISTDR